MITKTALDALTMTALSLLGGAAGKAIHVAWEKNMMNKMRKEFNAKLALATGAGALGGAAGGAIAGDKLKGKK